jgi:hypothetical protein
VTDHVARLAMPVRPMRGAAGLSQSNSSAQRHRERCGGDHRGLAQSVLKHHLNSFP